MAVMARDTWSDERLDELNARTDEGFKETRGEFRAVRSEMRQEFQAIRAEMKNEFQAVRAEMKGEFQALRGEMAAQAAMLNQTIYRLFGGMLVAWVVGIVAILARG